MKEEKLFRKFDVKIQIRDKILGGIPKNPKVIADWIAGSKGLTKEEKKEMAKKVAEEVDADTQAEKMWNTFKRDDKGIYIEERQVKAMLKECATTLRMTKKVGFRDGIAHGTFIKPERIYLHHDGIEGRKHNPDGFLESTIHVMTRQGPRDALKRNDYLEKAFLKFQIWCASPIITKDEIERLLHLGQEDGLGASRSQGFGKFDLIEFEPVKA